MPTGKPPSRTALDGPLGLPADAASSGITHPHKPLSGQRTTSWVRRHAQPLWSRYWVWVFPPAVGWFRVHRYCLEAVWTLRGNGCPSPWVRISVPRRCMSSAVPADGYEKLPSAEWPTIN